jgi:hypothetical protein
VKTDDGANTNNSTGQKNIPSPMIDFNSTGGPAVFKSGGSDMNKSHYASNTRFFSSASAATNAKMLMTGMSSLGVDGANT